MNTESLIKELEFNIDFFTGLADDLEKDGEGDIAEYCRMKTVEPLKQAVEFIRSGENEKVKG